MNHSNKPWTYIFILALVAIWSCEESDLPAPDQMPNTLNFNNPAVGQKAYYQRYQTSCSNLSLGFQFTTDTLVVELKQDELGFYLEERFTEHSPLYVEESDPYQLRITFENDYALIPNRWGSALFYFYGNDTLRLQPDERETLVQNGCRIDLGNETFIGNEIGQISRFQIGPLVEENQTVVSCVPIILSLDGYLIYNENELRMSHGALQDGSVNGWRLIE